MLREASRETRRTPLSLRLRNVLTSVTFVGCVVWTLTSYDPSIRLSETWAIAAAMLCHLMNYWSPTAPRYGRVAVVATLDVACWIATGLIVGGYSIDTLVVTGLGALAQAIVVGVGYLRWAEEPSWAPHSPLDVARLLGLSIAVSLVGSVLGIYPGTSFGGLFAYSGWWWIGRSTVYLVAGIGPWAMLVHWDRRPVHPETLRRLLPPLATALVITLWSCLTVYRWADLPLSWLILVAAVVSGLALSPRWAALMSIVLGIACTIAASEQRQPFAYGESPFPSSVVMDVLIAAGVMSTLCIALGRDSRSRLQQALDEQRRETLASAGLLRAVFRSMDDGLVLAGSDGRVSLFNRAARTLLGQPVPTAAPTSWEAHFGLRPMGRGEQHAPPEGFPMAVPLAPGQVMRAEYGVGDAEDQRVLSMSLQVVPTPVGEHRLVLFHDVTAEAFRRRELEGFARTIAHDLKQPLTAAVMLIEQAEQDLEAGEVTDGIDSLNRLRRASDRMSGMIDSWLAHTVTREGELRRAEIPLADLIDDILEIYRGSTLGPGPTFRVHAPHVVHVDPGLVRQLLANVIGNAVKYSRPEEPPDLTITSTATPDPTLVRIDIADRGLGLQPGDEKRIFAEFARSDKDALAVQGTGLGLALCAAIVKRHGGQIGAFGNDEGGATIWFTLPRGGR